MCGNRPSEYDPQLEPKCFCLKTSDRCLKHAALHPNIDTLIELLDQQVDSLLMDDSAVFGNLDMLEQSHTTLLESRKESFNRQIMNDYADKAAKHAELERKFACMAYNESEFEKAVTERNELAG